MKKILSFSMLLLLAFSLLFVSCRSDEDSSSSNNYIQVDGVTKYKISSAVVMGFKAQDATDTNVYSVSFISTDGTSTAKTVQLAVEFPYNQTIDGTYTISSTTRYLDDWLSSYTETSGSNSQSYNNLSVGTCTIKRNSTKNFTVTFSIKPSNGKVISGSFSGDVTLQES